MNIINPEDIPKLIKKEIFITLDIGENDINKDIYFLDNSIFDYKNHIDQPHSFLPELTDSNTKLFINNNSILHNLVNKN